MRFVRTVVLVGAALLFLALVVTAISAAVEALVGPSLWAAFRSGGYATVAWWIYPWLERRAVPSCSS